MPAKAAWSSQVDTVLAQLRQSPRSFFDRADIETLLGVRRRRAQQILAHCTTGHVGKSAIVDTATLVAYLEQVRSGEAVDYERRRRGKLARLIEQWQRQGTLRVEASLDVVHRQLDGLPSGVRLGPGRIEISFEQPQEALEKLLALAMAIGNDFDGFHRRTQVAAECTSPGMLED